MCGPVSARKSDPKPDLRQEHIIATGGDPQNGCEPQRVTIGFEFTNGEFIRDSRGKWFYQPEFFFSGINRLRMLNRAVNRKKRQCAKCGMYYSESELYRKDAKGKKRRLILKCRQCNERLDLRNSANRDKALKTLAKWHEHIRQKRDYYLWHIARYYAANYDRVTVLEVPLKDKIHYAVDSKAARKLCDAAYGKFIKMLEHKCAELNCQFEMRKDVKWQEEKRKAVQVAKRESLSKILRRAKTAVKYNCRERFKSLVTDCEQLTMLRI